MRILVTGGAGFIGSAVARKLITETEHEVINLDALTYAGDLKTLEPVFSNPQHIFVKQDIRDKEGLHQVFDDYEPDAVLHLAAESHVDRSIDSADDFITTNINGTHNLLAAALKYYDKLSTVKKKQFRFVHVSTDEVYGSLGLDDPAFNHNTPYRPNSPYSASKAASDHLARAWFKTYNLPVIITHCSNNYGPYQFPEKLIPVMINCALDEKPLPVYGTGENIRDWLYVDDHARALIMALEGGTPGAVYNIGGDHEVTNLDLVKQICATLDELRSRTNGKYEELISFVEDRKGHDFRYAVDISTIKNDLGWQPSVDFATGLKQTIQWYLDNPNWGEKDNDTE